MSPQDEIALRQAWARMDSRQQEDVRKGGTIRILVRNAPPEPTVFRADPKKPDDQWAPIFYRQASAIAGCHFGVWAVVADGIILEVWPAMAASVAEAMERDR